ncbi:helix-turn-helix domain-containing protein [Budviciaceae bacterium CWB-B4]|uniref:Helix-turn-helix domain-containing protein n=1 Tax=Limnobaculum xujianqingii TaxID=2738837 RepID=A0A9D7AHN3_9GAMM|nr:AraC family transcriptional regulator [Limnobaculum xujianqingii]MBK5072894.1 helix-turn-helix domain-containing protein [Limnobaculum xujianqingii]MBK5176203.1 helix-turn-helix domain-containing protein [Limnobaculum xujianqingii]
MFPFSVTKRLNQHQAELTVPHHEGHGYELVTFDKEKINIFAAQFHSCEPHWHNASEFIYVLQGGFAITVNRNVMKLTAGGMLYINQDEIHSLDATEPNSMLLTVQFSAGLFDDLHHELIIHYCVNSISDYNDKDRQLRATFISLVKDCLSCSDTASFHKMSLIYMLLAELENAGETIDDLAQVSIRKKDEQLIKECIEYINQHYSEEINLTQLAERAGVSYHYFSRLFKKISGYNFKEYLTYVRINKARFLLKNTQFPITDISHSCGFSEHKHLISVFRKYYLMTPTEFRKSYASENQEGFNALASDVRYIELSPDLLNKIMKYH